MSKWNWKELDTYNKIQKVLLLFLITNLMFFLIYWMDQSDRYAEMHYPIHIQFLIFWLIPLSVFAIYLFKD